jgi:hypothetical protein
MGWVRKNRGFCGALALFALALQITLSFGHAHLRDFVGIPGTPVALTQVSAPQGTNGGDASGQVSDDYCLVCATVALGGTLVLPVLPALSFPPYSTKVSHRYRLADRRGRFDHAPFSARAPPLA